MNRRLSIFLPALVLATSVARADAPPARPPDPGHEVEVEVRDEGPGQKQLAHFVLAVPGNGSAAVMSVGVGDAMYYLKVRHDPQAPALYELDLGRDQTRKGGATLHELHVVSSRALTAGQRDVLGAVQRPDGSHTEVALTLRP